MKKEIKEKVDYIILAAVAIAIMVFLATKGKSDAEFCRALFGDLAGGRIFAQKHLDWENLNMLGTDLGEVYQKLPNDKERADYRTSFIKGYAKGFKYSKMSTRDFTNWKTYDIRGDRVIVTCDEAKNKRKIFLTITKKGGLRKLVNVFILGPSEGQNK